MGGGVFPRPWGQPPGPAGRCPGGAPAAQRGRPTMGAAAVGGYAHPAREQAARIRGHVPANPGVSAPTWS